MSTRRTLLWLASALLGALLLILLVRVGHIDVRTVLLQLESVSLLAFLWLVVLNAALVYLSTEKWRSVDAVLRHSSDSVPSRTTSFTISGLGMALGLILPVQMAMATARTLGTYIHGKTFKRGTDLGSSNCDSAAGEN